MEINFKQFRLRAGLAGNDVVIADIASELANVLYDKGTGLACHALAFKIYNSEEGVVSLSPQEYRLLLDFSEQMMTPKFIDSLRAYENID